MSSTQRFRIQTPLGLRQTGMKAPEHQQVRNHWPEYEAPPQSAYAVAHWEAQPGADPETYDPIPQHRYPQRRACVAQTPNYVCGDDQDAVKQEKPSGID